MEMDGHRGPNRCEQVWLQQTVRVEREMVFATSAIYIIKRSLESQRGCWSMLRSKNVVLRNSCSMWIVCILLWVTSTLTDLYFPLEALVPFFCAFLSSLFSLNRFDVQNKRTCLYDLYVWMPPNKHWTLFTKWTCKHFLLRMPHRYASKLSEGIHLVPRPSRSANQQSLKLLIY